MSHPRYPSDIKNEAVDRVINGREPVAQVCKALRIKPGSVYLAIRKHQIMGLGERQHHVSAELMPNIPDSGLGW